MPSTPAPKRPLRIFILEDHIPTRQALERMVRGWGYPVASAETGAAALGTLRNAEFDMLLCDLHLPDMDGLDVLKRLGPEYRLFAVAMSGFEEYRAKSLEAGFRHFLLKPLHSQFLQSLIHEAEIFCFSPGDASANP